MLSLDTQISAAHITFWPDDTITDSSLKAFVCSVFLFRPTDRYRRAHSGIFLLVFHVVAASNSYLCALWMRRGDRSKFTDVIYIANVWLFLVDLAD